MKLTEETEYEIQPVPEIALLQQIIWRAFADLALEITVRREARKWLNKRYPTPFPPFSFQWICEHLDLDPDVLVDKYDPDNKSQIMLKH